MNQQHANRRPIGARPLLAARSGDHQRTAERSTPVSAGAWRLLGRALRLRCPNCAARDVRRTYFDFRPACPSCGLRLDRGEADYWIGGFMLNFVVGELIAVAAFVGAILFTWPDVPWRAVLYGSIVPAALGPALAYPFSRNLWLALDLLFRPSEPDDYAEPLA